MLTQEGIPTRYGLPWQIVACAICSRRMGAQTRNRRALLQDYPEGLTPAEIRERLGAERNLTDTCQGMLIPKSIL